MKIPKLLRKAEELLSADQAKQREQIKCFKEILGKLKKKKHKLKEKLKAEKNLKDREHIEKDLAIIHAQRKKGLQALKDLKKKGD